MLKNSQSSYGSVAKWLHWIVALCFLVAYVTVYTRHWFITDEHWFYSPSLQLHVTFGLSVFVWVILRLYWKLTNPQPQVPSMPHWQVHASHTMHWVLYFFMFAMPISGYFGFGGNTNYVLFQIPTFRNTGMGQWLLEVFNTDWANWETGWDFFHKKISGAAILWILIVIHAAAGLYHHYVQKDAVLVRMLPGKRARAEEAKRSAS